MFIKQISVFLENTPGALRELTEGMFGDTVAHIENVRKYITDQIKSVVGIAAKVKLVAPKSIPRSEGKAKRVIDNRKLN